MQVELKVKPYNARRYGKPWGAVVIFKDSKPVYDYRGSYQGSGLGGAVTLTAEPGDILVQGQRDNHHDGRMENRWYILREEGILDEVPQDDALRYYEARREKSPLPAGARNLGAKLAAFGAALQADATKIELDVLDHLIKDMKQLRERILERQS